MSEPTPIEILAEASPSAAEAFSRLRNSLSSGAISRATEELVVIGALASRGQLGSLRVHVRRALTDGVSLAEIRGAVLATLAASTLFGEAVSALKVVSEVAASIDNRHPIASAREHPLPVAPVQEFTAPLAAGLIAPEHPQSVVLLHSLALDRNIWNPLANVLSNQMAVLVCDLPGHGKSKLASEPTVEAMADLVAETIDAAGLGSTAVVGLSFGGSVAQALAVRHPGKVTALGLLDTTPYYGADAPQRWRARVEQAQRDGFESLSSFQLNRWFTDGFRKRRADVCAEVMETFLRADLEGYSAACSALGAMDLREEITKIDCPTLIVAGELDEATPPEHARMMHERIRGSQLHIIADCSHLSAIEKPVQVLSLLAPILGIG